MHMTAPMAGQKGHRHPVERAGEDRIRGHAPRGFHRAPFGPLQPVNLVEPGAPDYPDHCLCHVLLSCLMPLGVMVTTVRGK